MLLVKMFFLHNCSICINSLNYLIAIYFSLTISILIKIDPVRIQIHINNNGFSGSGKSTSMDRTQECLEMSKTWICCLGAQWGIKWEVNPCNIIRTPAKLKKAMEYLRENQGRCLWWFSEKGMFPWTSRMHGYFQIHEYLFRLLV